MAGSVKFRVFQKLPNSAEPPFFRFSFFFFFQKMYLMREKLVLNLYYPRISSIIVKNQKPPSRFTHISKNENIFFDPPLYGKREKIESSSLRHWKGKIKNYMNITFKSWSDNLCGVQNFRELMDIYVLLNHKGLISKNL